MASPTDELFDVSDRVALITGGNRGIGEMIARALVAGGADVLVNSRDAAACHRLAEELARSGRCRAVPGDLSTDDGIAGVAAATSAASSRLDLLVNNAGATWGAPIKTFPEQGWDKTMDLNLKAPFFLVQRLLPNLRAAAAGPKSPARIINIASIDGMRPPAFESYAYSASKAGMLMLTRHLAKQLARDNILVNAIAPGFFHTKMTHGILADDADATVEAIPLRRLGQPDDIAGVAIFLASRASAYLTGTTITCDGGLAST